MVELADTQDSGSCARKGVEVRLLSGVPTLRLDRLFITRFPSMDCGFFFFLSGRGGGAGEDFCVSEPRKTDRVFFRGTEKAFSPGFRLPGCISRFAFAPGVFYAATALLLLSPVRAVLLI